ncbi:MAG: MBL fold metallo-hydrolase [Firmicutes bacterium]|nr:MBL fold metallo-hydrolase [Bacillota bacterium]
MEIKQIEGVYTCITYLIDCGKSVVLVESSVDFETAHKHCGGKPIEAVLLTHGHFDHIAHAKEYQDKGAKLYIHSEDADCLYTDKNLAKKLGKKVEECTPDVLLKDGDCLQFGEQKIRVVHTPGHTKGGVCYLVGNQMFSGDTLFFNDYGRTDLPGGSEQELTQSVRKILKTTDAQTKVYPGHGRSTTIQAERVFFENTIGKL